MRDKKEEEERRGRGSLREREALQALSFSSCTKVFFKRNLKDVFLSIRQAKKRYYNTSNVA